MTQIDYYFSTFSPFTYFAGDGLEQIAQKHGCQITYKPLDLIGLFARTGWTPPPQRHENRQVYRLQELRRLAKSIASGRESVRLAESSLETEQIKLGVGSNNPFDVQQANQNLREARSRLLRNLLDYRIAEYRLLHVQGVLEVPEAP